MFCPRCWRRAGVPWTELLNTLSLVSQRQHQHQQQNHSTICWLNECIDVSIGWAPNVPRESYAYVCSFFCARSMAAQVGASTTTKNAPSIKTIPDSKLKNCLCYAPWIVRSFAVVIIGVVAVVPRWLQAIYNRFPSCSVSVLVWPDK